MSRGPSRRGVLRLGAAAAVAPLALRRAPALAAGPELLQPFAWTNAEQRPNLAAAVDRIIPPFESSTASFPGAGAAGAVDYVEFLLAAFDVPPGEPPHIYPAGGWDPHGTIAPGDECDGGGQGVPDAWLHLPKEKEIGWKAAIARYQQAYLAGLDLLESDSRAHFGTSFRLALPAAQTLLLETWDGLGAAFRPAGVTTSGAGESALRPRYGAPGGDDVRGTFFNLLFAHVMEGVYGDPVYRGNRDRIGWRLVGFGGPRHPQGYTPEEVEHPAPCAAVDPGNRKVVENLVGGG